MHLSLTTNCLFLAVFNSGASHAGFLHAKICHILFCTCFQGSASHWWILSYFFAYIQFQYFLWGNLFSTDSVKPFRFLSVQFGHTLRTPKGQQITACLSHQFINLCGLGSCYFIHESLCPKMPEILLPFHSLNQNWKLLSHSALICQLDAACRAILLWIIWKASLSYDPQRSWDPHLSVNFGGGEVALQGRPLCWKGWQVSHWPEKEQD